MCNFEQQRQAQETIAPKAQPPLDKGDVTEPAHNEAAPLLPIGRK